MSSNIHNLLDIAQSEYRRTIAMAAEVLRKGGLVAFPTETVYGLGANALDEGAIKRVFSAKNRPYIDPLIVHISEMGMLDMLAVEIPEQCLKLVKKIWPGPLTIVVKKSKKVPDIATASKQTVAIRMPAHKVASDLLSEAGVPLVAPSANQFGHVSPTSAGHVYDDLGSLVDVILDYGPTRLGIESTVIDFSEPGPPVVLRPGCITIEELSDELGEAVLNLKRPSKAPGFLKRHYAPNFELIVLNGSQGSIIKYIMELGAQVSGRTALVIYGGYNNLDALRLYTEVFSIGANLGLKEVAASLYNLLRELEKKGYQRVFVQGLPEEGLGLSIMDRLKKAAKSVVDLT